MQLAKKSKKYFYKGESVTIIKTIEIPQPNVGGRAVPSKPLIDKEGEWVQIQFEAGQKVGCRAAVLKKSLTKTVIKNEKDKEIDKMQA